MQEIIVCSICESEKFENITTNQSFRYNSEVVQCQNCKFAWLKRQFDDDELCDFYNRTYRQRKKEILDRQRKAGDLVRSRSQHSFYSNYIEPNDSILEIGAAYGINANFLYCKGFRNIAVTEFDQATIVKYLHKEIKIIQVPFAQIEDNSFDMVIMSHVLEHLYDIRAKIEKLKYLLKQSGRLFVEVPNNANQRISKYMSTSYHYLFFTKRNLTELFEKYDFKIIKLAYFGKEKLLGSLTEREIKRYEQLVLSNDHFDDIIEVDEKDKNALWLRILVRKHDKEKK